MNFNQIRFLVILILSGCFAFWVFNIFSGPEAITYILNNYTKLWLLIFAHLPSLIFDSLAWMVLMTKKKIKVFLVLLHNLDFTNLWKVFAYW